MQSRANPSLCTKFPANREKCRESCRLSRSSSEITVQRCPDQPRSGYKRDDFRFAYHPSGTVGGDGVTRVSCDMNGPLFKTSDMN